MTDRETLRRVRAAIAYADREQHEIAASLDVHPRTLERWKAEGVPRQKVNLPLLAAECGLPPAFFYADFARLDEIVATSPRDEARALPPEPLPPLPGEAERRHGEDRRRGARGA
jgi:hypothetical protein